MKIALCIDDDNGMMFNKRRQSRDSELIKDLISLAGERKILILPFSEILFSGYEDKITVSDDIISSAEDDDICFLENTDPAEFEDKISEIILYRWNRRYPSDLKFTLDLSGYTLKNQTEFAGSSHEKITREEYVK